MRPTVKLGEICKFQNGFAFKSELFKAKGEPILRISNIQKDNISDEKLVFFDLKDYDNLDTYIVNPGELVIAMSGATTGKIAINNTNKKYYLNQRVGKFSFDNDITKEYCHYFLGTKVEENLNKAAGAAIQNLSSKQILDIEIPLPPLETQKVIVAKLDQIFAELDQTKSEIQKNLDNTDELWKSALNQAFQGDWEMKKLDNIVDFSQGIQVPIEDQSMVEKPGLVRFLRIIDFTQGGQEPRYVENFGDRYYVNNDDLSMVRYGATTGFICSGMEGIIANNLFKITPKKENILKKYLYVYFKSPYFDRFLQKEVFGAAMPAISFGTLKNVEIPVPPLSEQEKIVEHLDQVSKEVKALKSQYQSQLDNLEELKKSVLDKAFRGELGE